DRNVTGVQTCALPICLVGFLVHLDVQVACRATTRADLTLTGQPDPHTVTDAGWNLRGHLPTYPHPAVTTALLARVGDDLAEALAHRARASSDHLAEERTLYRLDLTLPLTGVAGLGRRP